MTALPSRDPIHGRSEEVEVFKKAFLNGEARGLYERMLRQSYYTGILHHHPQAETFTPEDCERINKKVQALIDRIFLEIDQVLTHEPDQLFSTFQGLSRKAASRLPEWFSELDLGYTAYKHKNNVARRYPGLKRHLLVDAKGTPIRTFVGFGCGAGDLEAHIRQNHLTITEVKCVDVVDWRSEQARQVNMEFEIRDLSIRGTRCSHEYDAGTSLQILHHPTRLGDDSIDAFLTGIASGIRRGGVLLVEEDVMLPQEDIDRQGLTEQVESAVKRVPLYGEFLGHSEEGQRLITTLNEFIANSLTVGVFQMPFLCGLRRLGTEEGWVNVFSRNGFSIRETEVIGFIPGHFHYGSHVRFVLDRY